jgi:hypothetical protein
VPVQTRHGWGTHTMTVSAAPVLGPFLCLRNHDGKGVQRVNEGSSALMLFGDVAWQR